MLPQPERAPLSWDERMEPFGCPLAVYDIFLDIPAVQPFFILTDPDIDQLF